MRTVGKLLKEARRRRKISVARLSEKTKIKEQFLVAIEQEQWRVLPNFATALGFVRNVAVKVGISPETAAALLRRDFPPEVAQKESGQVVLWTPQATKILAIFLITSAILFYLIRQYISFVAPPQLSLVVVKNEKGVEISGKTSPQASVLIAGEPVLVEKDGSFKINLSGQTGEELVVESFSRVGKATKKKVIIP